MDFSTMYDEYFDPVYNYVRCRIAERAAAEDVCSRVFEAALKGLKTYDASRNGAAPWLFGIARNEVNLHYRRIKLRRWLPLDWLGDLPHPAEHALEELVDAESQKKMLDAVAALQDRERELIALKFFSGMNNREIATLTGLSESNAGTIIHRAVGKLRARFFKEGLL